MPAKRKRKPTGKKTRVKKSKLSLDEQIKQMFTAYADDGLIEDEGLLRFISDIEIVSEIEK
jgi:hypothetical protein